MKVETKAELRERIASLEKQAQKLSDELEAQERETWNKRKPKADAAAHREIGMVFPNTYCNLLFDHVDKSGYWYHFQLINDDRRQTYCVRHEEVEGE